MLLKKVHRMLADVVSPGGANGKLQIFIFHRVLDRPDFLAPGEPDVVQFDKMIDLISATFNILSLQEATERLKSKALPRRAACITFDDGYIDNFTNALPIFKKYDIPATIFIATDFVDGGMMWNDVVIESIRNFNQLFSYSELDINEVDCNVNAEKLALINRIILKIKHLPQEKRSEIVKAIEEKTQYGRQPFMMSKEQILELHGSGVTIGAHTCSHPILKNLNDDVAEAEIARSKEILEDMLKDKVDYFAYPNGRPGEDYSVRDVNILNKLGFKAAVSTHKKVASSQDNILEIPRFTPWDQNLNKFMLRSLVENFRAQ